MATHSSILAWRIPWTIQSVEFSRVEYWNGKPFPSLGDLSNPGIEPRSSTLQVDSLPSKAPGKLKNTGVGSLFLFQEIFLTQEFNWSPALQVDILPAEPPGKPLSFFLLLLLFFFFNIYY